MRRGRDRQVGGLPGELGDDHQGWGGRGWELDFDCADVAFPAGLLGPDQARLIRRDTRRQGSGLTRRSGDRVDQRAARLRQLRLGRSTVGGERTKQRVVRVETAISPVAVREHEFAVSLAKLYPSDDVLVPEHRFPVPAGFTNTDPNNVIEELTE
jgi:hypothetical protein